jgi:hypothetical protein
MAQIAAGSGAVPKIPSMMAAAPAAGPGAAGPMSAGTPATLTPAIAVMGVEPKQLPTEPEPCPELNTGTVMILGTTVNVWVGTKSEKKAPIFISWHGTGGGGGFAMQALGAFGQAILAEGGIIAAPNESTKKGVDTGNAVWFTGDFDIADEIVACSIKQLNVDTTRIWTSGGSAGGLQAGAMVYWRSSYLAASMPISGGVTFRPGVNVFRDASRPAALYTIHGAMGMDVVSGLDFASASLQLDKESVAKGGYAIDCDTGGGHGGAPPEILNAGYEFLKAHPYGVTPEPYLASLPTLPAMCTVIR